MLDLRSKNIESKKDKFVYSCLWIQCYSEEILNFILIIKEVLSIHNDIVSKVEEKIKNGEVNYVNNKLLKK